ncbi:hypothetical protein AX14_013101, partial [Amanita brunnescens Koide BX004]
MPLYVAASIHTTHSPSLSIPVDIIQEIFGHLASPVLDTHPGCHFPWVLGQICSDWRAIFLSMKPQFWSRIAIRYEELEFNPQKVRRSKEILEFFLNRDRAAPFSFDYMMLVRGMTIPMHPVLDLLVEESTRWESASITISPEELPIVRRIRNRLPSLRKLDVTALGPGFPIASNDMFEHAPLLQEIALSDFSWKLNWSALTIVTLKTSVEDTLAILPHISNVEILSLVSTYSKERARINGRVGSITLSRLNTLVIAYDIPLCIDLLRAPELKTLIFLPFTYTQFSENNWSLITSFLSQSSCTIRSLNLNVIDKESLTDVLRSAPNIVSLTFTLSNKWRGSRCLACLSFPGNYDDGSPEFLARHLKSLTIVAFPYGGHTDQPFLRAEIDTLICIVKSRTVVLDTNDSIMERLLNLTVDMPYNAALPNELVQLMSLCAEVGVVFRYSLGGGMGVPAPFGDIPERKVYKQRGAVKYL